MRTSIAWAVTAQVWLLALAVPPAVRGQEPATPAYPLKEIIVTAQKWEQAANTVGMSITAATGEALLQYGITSVAGLTRLVPGLTIQESSFNSTSFTLRGVGFFNSDLATPPAVTVYLDEASLPYPAMTKLIAFDLARVEVLKGPKGTLYGQNATGGAVNYIAAKPTEAFDTGMDGTYGRFNRLQVGSYVGGPISGAWVDRRRERFDSGQAIRAAGVRTWPNPLKPAAFRSRVDEPAGTLHRGSHREFRYARTRNSVRRSSEMAANRRPRGKHHARSFGGGDQN